MSLLRKLHENATEISTRVAEGTKGLSERAALEAKEGFSATAKYVSDAKTRVFSEGLPEIIIHLQNNDKHRLFLADSLSSAYDSAAKDASWDEILKAALLDLQQTPAGKA